MVSERLVAVTYLTLPSRAASPLRWQRSSGAMREMKSGFQMAVKALLVDGVARQEYLVLTNTSLPPVSTVIS